MKKKLRYVLMAVVMIPCMLVMSACGASEITLNEYSGMVKSAGDRYVSKYTQYDTMRDYKIVDTKHEVVHDNEEYTYKENQDATELVTKEHGVTTTATLNQTIVFDKIDVEDGRVINAKLTQVSTEEYEGFEVNDTTKLLESVTKKNVETLEVTYVKDGEDYKQYVYEYEAEYLNNELVDEEVVRKTVYTYTLYTTYKSDVQTLVNNASNKLVNTFFNTSMYVLLPNAYYYEDGNLFGVEYGMNTVSSGLLSGEYYVNGTETNSYIKFKDNLPSVVKESEEVKTALGTDVEENKTTLTYDKTSVGIGASDSVITMTKYNYTIWS